VGRGEGTQMQIFQKKKSDFLSWPNNNTFRYPSQFSFVFKKAVRQGENKTIFLFKQNRYSYTGLIIWIALFFLKLSIPAQI